MRRRYRYPIIAVLFLAFFTIAPAVLVYTAGYSYNWKKVRFEKTGLLVVDTVPTGASVFVNDVQESQTTPMTVYRLLPDDYMIRLELPGFLTWRKTLTVHSTETTFAKDVLLFRDVLPRLDTAADASKAAVRADGTAAVIASGDQWTELALATPDGKTANLARFASGQLDRPEISWSPDGARLLLTGESEGKGLIYVYRPTTGESTAVRAPLAAPDRTASGGLRRARWNADGRAISAVTDLGAVVWRGPDAFAEPVPGTAGAEDALLDDGDLYFIRQSPADPPQANLKNGQDAATIKTLWRIPTDASRPAERVAELDDARLELADLAPGRISISRTDGSQLKTYATAGGAVLVQGAGRRVRWENGAGKGRMLVWNDFEISVMDPSSGRRDVITRLSSPIADCTWHPAGLDVICATSEGIFAAELDDRGGRNVFELARFPSVAGFALDPKGAVMYLVGAVGKQRGLYERPL